MLNRVELGTIGREVGDADFDAQFIHQLLQVFFENEMQGTVRAAPIAQTQDGSSSGKGYPAIVQPPIPNTITGKLAGILTGSKMQIALIMLQVINTVRDI